MSEKFVVVPEKCRVCGCTELSPCVFTDREDDAFWGLTCGWMEVDHTLCSNLQCLARIPMNQLLEMPLFRIAMARERTA